MSESSNMAQLVGSDGLDLSGRVAGSVVVIQGASGRGEVVKNVVVVLGETVPGHGAVIPSTCPIEPPAVVDAVGGTEVVAERSAACTGTRLVAPSRTFQVICEDRDRQQRCEHDDHGHD